MCTHKNIGASCDYKRNHPKILDSTMSKDLTSQIEALQKTLKENGRQIFLEMKILYGTCTCFDCS